MNQLAGRNAVFLEEMGVGPLWRPRAVAAASAPAMSETQSQAAAQPAPVAVPVSAPAPVPAPSPVALASVAAPAPSAPVLAPIPRQPAPVHEPAAAPIADASTAWFDDAPTPAPAAPVSDAAIAAMDWEQLTGAIAKCTRCDLCRSRKAAVPGRGGRQAAWLFVGSAPSRLDEKERRALGGDAGTLFDNMLLALDLVPGADVYVTNLLKCRALDRDGAERAPAAPELAACRPFFERELALTGARRIVSFGQGAVRGLLGSPSAARGAVHRLKGNPEGGLPVVATYHPQDLLRQPGNKAKAWADLCLARGVDDTPG